MEDAETRVGGGISDASILASSRRHMICDKSSPLLVQATMAASIFPHFEVEHTFLISNNLVQFPYAYFADYGLSGSCGQIQIAWCSSESLPRCGSQAHCIHDEGVCWLREPYTACPSFTLHRIRSVRLPHLYVYFIYSLPWNNHTSHHVFTCSTVFNFYILVYSSGIIKS